VKRKKKLDRNRLVGDRFVGLRRGCQLFKREIHHKCVHDQEEDRRQQVHENDEVHDERLDSIGAHVYFTGVVDLANNDEVKDDGRQREKSEDSPHCETPKDNRTLAAFLLQIQENTGVDQRENNRPREKFERRRQEDQEQLVQEVRKASNRARKSLILSWPLHIGRC